MFRSQEELEGGFAGFARSPLNRSSQLRASFGAGWLERLAKITSPVDLADEIGSPAWVRGLLVLAALSASAIAFWPDFTLAEPARAMASEESSRDHFRSQMVSPLATGPATDRHAGLTRRVKDIAFVPERATMQRVLQVAEGDTLSRLLQRGGVVASDAETADALVGSAMQGAGLTAGTRVAITAGARDPASGLRALQSLSLRARIDLGLVIARRDGVLTALPQPVDVNTEPLRIRGRVGASLYRSARAAGAPMKAVQQYLQTLSSHLGMEESLTPEDAFDIVVSYRSAPGGLTETGALLYAGLERDGKPLAQLVRWGDKGAFVDVARAQQWQAVGLGSPVAGRLTSGFGYRRHPILGYTRMHGGVDFGAAWGAPIHATADATVSYAGWHGGHGKYVRLEHGGGLGTGYAHMSQITVSDGERVRAGQVIGYVGSTGLSTGPHLHFEMYRGGQRINPLSVAFTSQPGLDAKVTSAIKARLAQLQAISPL